ncbi:MAG TPA: GGDEF domain-containing protein [Gemmatimonadaceae bacterium]|nr:GGDEF domain-containing protein [Gemmatimonadaceae bacterium]
MPRLPSPRHRPWRPSSPWAAFDPVLADTGLAGERLVAHVRLALVGLLFLVPLRRFFGDPITGEGVIALAVAVWALTVAVLMLVITRRGMYRRWFGFASAIFDVSLVTLALGLGLVNGNPLAAVNSRVVFEAYFVTIGATALRYDRRICWVAGLTAAAQYLLVVLIVVLGWSAADLAALGTEYGRFAWATQLSRVGMLVFATVLASAIVRRAEQLRELSTTDALTGLPNRGYFDQRLMREMTEARSLAKPLAVALVDVDRFKQFNDSYGHAAGDVALKTVAQAMRAHAGSDAIVMRYGGEEFVVAYPATTLETAMVRLERLRRGVMETIVPFEHPSGPLRVTVSIGVAAFPVDGWEADEVVHRADERLYAAKVAGRNRIVGADDAPIAASASA